MAGKPRLPSIDSIIADLAADIGRRAAPQLDETGAAIPAASSAAVSRAKISSTGYSSRM